jgi:glutaminase
MDADRAGDGRERVSTGQLPDAGIVTAAIEASYRAAGGERHGTVSSVYPALAAMPPDLFGLAIVSTGGSLFTAGDCDHPFTLMSVSKPFVFALAVDRLGEERVRALVGANATGRPFNSLAAVEAAPGGRTNPMVNSGAIATTSLALADGMEAGWRLVEDGLSGFAGRPLALDRATLASALATNQRNRALATLLESLDALAAPPDLAVELYTRQCCLEVTARDLAVMGATLANGGVNPVTGLAVVGARACHYAMAAMVTAGLYETSGDWLFDVGVPAKSGIGGGIVAAATGKGGLGTFAPRLDAAGNSVRGQIAARYLSRVLGLNLLFAEARPRAAGP